MFLCGVCMQDKAPSWLINSELWKRARFPAHGRVGPGGPSPSSVGFTIAVHVVGI